MTKIQSTIRAINSEFQVEESEQGFTIRFTPILFNVESQRMPSLRGEFVEIITPEAFDSADKTDIRALFNHNPDYVMGRSRGKPLDTMTFEKTARGIEVVCKVPKTQWAADMVESVKRGDISGCSFRFWASGKDYEWVRDEARGLLIGTLKTCRTIDDFSIVTYPAYKQTEDSVIVRSLIDFVDNETIDEGVESQEIEDEEVENQEIEGEENAKKSRMKMLFMLTKI